MKPIRKNLSERQLIFKKIFLRIKETFPFESKKEFLKFKNLYQKYYGEIKNIPENDRYFFLHIERFLASLRNSHTKLGNYPGKIFFRPKGYSVLFLNKKFYLRKGANIVGEVLEIDNKKPIEILNFHIGRISSSTRQYSIYRALMFLLTDQEGAPVCLEIKKINGKVKKLILRREKIVFIPFKKLIMAKMLKNNLGYLKIISWVGKNTKSHIDKAVGHFIKKWARALIVDVRNNDGGNSNIAKHLAAHLFEKKVSFSVTKYRVSRNNFKLQDSYNYVEPKGPYLSIPVILLIDAACFSSNEYFIGGLKDKKRAYLIGETTGGGSGNPKKFTIPYKDSSFELLVSSWQYYRPNMMPLEGRGIKPHSFVKPTLQDFIKRYDRVLEVAIDKAKEFY